MINNTNTQDIFMRNAIAGVLDCLNRNVYIEQTVDGKRDRRRIKFYYNFGQDEQFMKDFFVELDHGCMVHQHAEGNFDTRPLGMLKFDSFSIRTSDMTNKYVRASFVNESYTDNMQKQLAAYSAYMMRLPMTIKMSVDIHADNLGQAMRVSQGILIALYKSNTVYFQYGGMRVPGELLIADNTDLEKKTEFTYDDDQKAHVKFDLDFNTTFPLFDEPSVMTKARKIKEFRMSLYDELNIPDGPIINQTVSSISYIESIMKRTDIIIDPSKL